MKSTGRLQWTTTSIFDSSLLEILSAFGGNSGSIKFLYVFSKRIYSILSRDDSANGKVLKIFLDFSMREFKFAWAFP